MESRFDCLSPIDYRYWDKDVAEYLSEDGFTKHKLLVELALVQTLHRRGLCTKQLLDEVKLACEQVTTSEVYDEEDRVRHDIRALVNRIREKVSDSAKPFVHMTATSFDISDTANALRYKNVVLKVLVPALSELVATITKTTLLEADTVQVGRTHGQHAVPITFGFALAGFVSRLGNSILSLETLANKLPGKFSGAVGAYNASSLFFKDPEKFEGEVLMTLGLIPAEHSTQIVPPEALIRLLCEITIVAGILANLADNMRHLQRTEIGEVGEKFEAAQVGSSTMPQKRNPINFENVKSLWKIVVSRITTLFMDQLSEHERDLTNSASARTYGETIAYVVSMTKRMTRTMNKLAVDHDNLKRNLALQQGLVVAEPLYIILAALGHPHAHEKVRQLTLRAQKENKPLQSVAIDDPEIKPFIDRMTPHQWKILTHPEQYIGIAPDKAKNIAIRWKGLLRL